MVARFKKAILLVLKPTWLTGPIFEKELRVSSRRRRSYVLRFFYILLLTVFVALVWLSVAQYEGNVSLQRSRMSVAGREIVVTVVIFQFIAAQVLAIIMLSTAISDEVYHRTLGLLMTTPITGLQIVMGKVLSKLLQLVLLLAITFPILAIVRIFGGVPWNYLLSSFCITLTAAIFAGSISLLISIENRRAYAVITRTVFALFCLYLVFPLLLMPLAGYFGLLQGSNFLSVRSALAWPESLIVHSNPFYALVTTTNQMMESRSRGTGSPIWPLHCGVMLAMSAGVLAWSSRVVRRVALRQVTGQLGAFNGDGRVRDKNAAHSGSGSSGRIKRVTGPAVIWKELRAPFIQGVDNRNSRIGLAATIAVLAITYISGYYSHTLQEEYWHVSYGLLFVGIGTLATVVFAATRITTERESQTWSLLLATTLQDKDILLGKAVSAFRRVLPIWGLLAGHMVLFVLIGYIHPIAILHMIIVVTWLTCFVTGVGLYFSARFARTTSAVVASFGVLLGLWAVGPIVAGLLSVVVGRLQGEVFANYMLTHPAIQTELVLAGAGGSANGRAAFGSLVYGERSVLGFALSPFGFGRMTQIVTFTGLVYVVIGLILFYLARRRLRTHIF